MKASPPYCDEVLEALAAGRHPEVVVFHGIDAHERAHDRRRKHGPGTALVLPQGAHPSDYSWPKVYDVAVISTAPNPKAALRIRAMIRDVIRLGCSGL